MSLLEKIALVLIVPTLIVFWKVWRYFESGERTTSHFWIFVGTPIILVLWLFWGVLWYFFP